VARQHFVYGRAEANEATANAGLVYLKRVDAIIGLSLRLAI